MTPGIAPAYRQGSQTALDIMASLAPRLCAFLLNRGSKGQSRVQHGSQYPGQERQRVPLKNREGARSAAVACSFSRWRPAIPQMPTPTNNDEMLERISRPRRSESSRSADSPGESAHPMRRTFPAKRRK